MPALTTATTSTTSRSRAYQFRETDVVLNDQPGRAYVLRFRDMDDASKPREKIIAAGAHSLTVAELVAIIFATGTSKEDVMQMARRAVKEYGEHTISHQTNPKVVAETLGISELKACQLVASFELGRRYYARDTGLRPTIRTSRQAYAYLKSMGSLRKEQLRGLYLNSRYEVIHDEVVSIGSVTANIVHPREVFQPAIEHAAVAVLVAHNHPSGQVAPTMPDVDITDQLVEAGRVLGIELIDHLIIAGDHYVSLLDAEADAE